LETHASPPVEIAPISRLFCSPSNPRHNDAAVPHVAASLRRFGWQQPIVARRQRWGDRGQHSPQGRAEPRDAGGPPELDAPILHKRGRDVSELMALLDRASRAGGEEREEAIERVCAMAAEGRIYW